MGSWTSHEHNYQHTSTCSPGLILTDRTISAPLSPGDWLCSKRHTLSLLLAPFSFSLLGKLLSQAWHGITALTQSTKEPAHTCPYRSIQRFTGCGSLKSNIKFNFINFKTSFFASSKMMASFFKCNQCRIISPSWVDKCPCACLWECLWCLHTVDAGTCAGTHCDWDHLTNVTWSLSTFEADSTCQSALCVECFLDACCHLEGVGCVCVCVCLDHSTLFSAWENTA